MEREEGEVAEGAAEKKPSKRHKPDLDVKKEEVEADEAEAKTGLNPDIAALLAAHTVDQEAVDDDDGRFIISLFAWVNSSSFHELFLFYYSSISGR